MDLTRVRSAAIVGAGVAGLATARELMTVGVDCTLFERNDAVGGVWFDGYLNFGVQVQRELYEFPDWPLPADTPDFAPGPVIQQYLKDFADQFGITPHIRFSTEVKDVREAAGPGPHWNVTYGHGDETSAQTFDMVVICIGLYSNVPNIPDFPNRSQFSGSVIHNSKLKSPEQLSGKRVAVVGYGKSATDAAVESAMAARETHIIFRDAHWPIPQKLAGVLPFKWGLLHRLNSTLIPLYQNPTPLERAIHQWGKPLVWFHWRLVETLLRFQFQLGGRFGTRVSLIPDAPIEIGAFNESTMIPRGDFYRLARSDTIQLHRTTIESYTKTGIRLKDDSSLDLDLIVMATGWATDFGFLSDDIRKHLDMEDDGFYLYRHVLKPGIPGLAFIGRASSISSILTYCLQARWLAGLIGNQFKLPERQSMEQDVERMKIWKRSWIPFSAARSARLIAHTQHYHDELLRDMDADPLRKTGPLAPLKELIAPYVPGDYASFLSRPKRETDL